jgi:hypothetical protein
MTCRWAGSGTTIERGVLMQLRRIQFGLVLSLYLCGLSEAQGPIQPVRWSASTISYRPVKPEKGIAIELSAEVEDGWHVYGLTQVPGGPTPLRVALDENESAQLAGPISGTDPVRKHDPSFDLETQFYLHAFSVHIPVQLKQHLSLGTQPVPVSVRFQACSDRTCLPPRTVHLSVPIEILP